MARITGIILMALLAMTALACIEFDRLTIEVGAVQETAEGITVDVTVSNVGDDQTIESVETGLLGIDSTGSAWSASDACSTLDGQTIAAGQPVTATLCFPFEAEDDEGNLDAYIPSGTKIAYILATDNLFAGDDSKYYLLPVGGTGVSLSEPAEPPSPATPVAATATVEVRVWQSTGDPLNIYISARPEGGDWSVLGTIPLPLDEEASGGSFRYGDIAVEVEIGGE